MTFSMSSRPFSFWRNPMMWHMLCRMDRPLRLTNRGSQRLSRDGQRGDTAVEVSSLADDSLDDVAVRKIKPGKEKNDYDQKHVYGQNHTISICYDYVI